MRPTPDTITPGTHFPACQPIRGPIALIEVGASAGLCLYPDRYRYTFRTPTGDVHLDPATGPSAVALECDFSLAEVADRDPGTTGPARNAADHEPGTAATGPRGTGPEAAVAGSDPSSDAPATTATPPTRLPEVVWRAGLDLNPFDITDPAEQAWLTSLVWPEHKARRQRLTAAAAIAAADPPHLVTGDLCEAIEALIAEAPAGSQVVVFHSAVLAYVEPPRRDEFASLMRSRDDVVWISNEGERVLPDIGDQLAGRLGAGSAGAGGRFILAVDGVATVLTGPHGQSFEALPTESAQVRPV